MEKQLKEMLQKIIANQVVIYKRLEKIENEVKGKTRLAGIKTYVDELDKKAKEVLPLLD